MRRLKNFIDSDDSPMYHSLEIILSYLSVRITTCEKINKDFKLDLSPMKHGNSSDICFNTCTALFLNALE